MARQEHTDRQLVLRLHQDEVAAFDLLYEKYHQAIYRNCYKLCRDEDASQDILQDVFVALWEKRLAISEDQPVGAWLFVVSFNRSVSVLRAQLKTARALAEMPFSEAGEEGVGEDLSEQQYGLLLAAVGRLSPQKQKVFTLCKLEGKSYQEAADELHLSKHTVKEYLGLAVSAVRENIRENPELWGTTALLLFWKVL